ncbi:muscle M-line assembly protein unc-89-like isoform X2 [Hermetia illucens]|uniref:muscle M-line assembly protein unc-89-like isoform X2 n=1 Tax=Hermetia illucens TaxID=343691 RepID=UPI0018CC3EE0|nr:muscle M-line assembly protein unc-89-like isoform X2 [Hermetia illucens]
MTSRTIEIVEVDGKTLFYEIRIENVEFHILGQTVKTNKWLRFEEWQQIYEQLNKSLSTYPATPPDFTIKSFTVGNYIRVEIELFPIENCFGDLFNVKLDNCVHDYLQIRIKQISLGSNLEEIQQAERKNELSVEAMAKRNKRDVKKRKKKRKSCSLSEYNPVAVKKDIRSKDVPLYKPSKLSPEAKEADEPYSPKPVNSGDNETLTQDDYSPYTISSSDNTTPTVIPTYKPSAIIKKSSDNQPEKSPSPSTINPNPDVNESNSTPLSALSIECDEIKDSSTPVTSTDSTLETNTSTHSRRRRCITPDSHQNKRPKLSQDLFECSEDELKETKSEDESEKSSSKTTKKGKFNTIPEEPKLESSTSSTTSLQKSKETSDESVDKEAAKQEIIAERRSKRTPIKKHEKYAEYDWLSTDPTKSQRSGSSASNKSSKTKKRKREKESKPKKSPRSEGGTPTPSQESGPSKTQREPTSLTTPIPTTEELQQKKEAYERQIELLDKWGKNLREMNKAPPELDDIFDLNDMKTSDLIDTFEQFKPELDKHFNKYKNQKFKQESSEKLCLLILNIITREQVVSMMDHLQSVYEPECDGMPTYTDLFMNVMAPEWVLLLFMKQYGLPREEAIERIKVQRDIETYNQTLVME